MRKFLLSLIGMFAIILTANAIGYTHTFNKNDLVANSTKELSGIKWTAITAGSIGWSQTRGIQLGSGNNVCKEFSLKTSDFKDFTIKSVTVYSTVASSGDAKLSLIAATK